MSSNAGDLIRMANQIADFYRVYTEEEAIQGIADHIKSFWDPRMRREFSALIASGATAELRPIVLTACERISPPQQ
ncbi:MAG: formate dehydrogenase subunit delta [Alphaproteobacteria bacterium]|jgi:formate dehydrogenase subunit delta